MLRNIFITGYVNNVIFTGLLMPDGMVWLGATYVNFSVMVYIYFNRLKDVDMWLVTIIQCNSTIPLDMVINNRDVILIDNTVLLFCNNNRRHDVVEQLCPRHASAGRFGRDLGKHSQAEAYTIITKYHLPHPHGHSHQRKTNGFEAVSFKNH